jgi:hypothetical protein
MAKTKPMQITRAGQAELGDPPSLDADGNQLEHADGTRALHLIGDWAWCSPGWPDADGSYELASTGSSWIELPPGVTPADHKVGLSGLTAQDFIDAARPI